MGYGTITLFMLFFICFGLGLMGYQSAALAFVNLGFGNGFGSLASLQSFIILLLAAISVTLLPFLVGGALTSNFGVMYTIPLAIASITAGILFLPLSFINEAGFPPQVSGLLLGFFGLLILITMLDYIRGSGGGF